MADVRRRYGQWVVRLRLPIIAWWVVVLGAVAVWLPSVHATGAGTGQFGQPARAVIQAEARSTQTFGYPVLSRVAVVQRAPGGLSASAQAAAIRQAAAVDLGGRTRPIVAAVPVSNALGLFPGARERGTTIITWLYLRPDVAPVAQQAAAQRYADELSAQTDTVVGVAGSVPARNEQSSLIDGSLRWVEIAAVAAVFLIVAVAFRSPVAPVVTLSAAGVAIFASFHLAGAISTALGVPVPAEMGPLLVALLLGVVTDYSVFYLSAMRRELASGSDPRTAAAKSAAAYSPIIAMAGIAVALGTGALIVARSPIFRAFGPAMAMAVLTGMLVAVTLTPALLALFGDKTFWPGRSGGVRSRRRRIRPAQGSRWSRLISRRPFATVVLVIGLAGLVVAALPLRHFGLGLPYTGSLPSGNSVRYAAEQARSGFADGILSPTELVVRAPGIADEPARVGALQTKIGAEPGVAGVLGPAGPIVPSRLGPFQAPDGNAIRYLIILSDAPQGRHAIDTLDRIEADLPRLQAEAGLAGAQTAFIGDTAIARAVVEQTRADLTRIAGAALLANFLVLALFLQALVAPLLLIGTSVLGIAATLGLTITVFYRDVTDDGFTFYVPFAVAVLLLSLGSDYNVFSVGRIWREAGHRPLREALAATLPRSAAAIRTAGLTLAVSFAILAIVPVRPFHELAFAMSVGIIIDAAFLRSVLVPAMLSLVGPVAGWPGRRLMDSRPNRAASSTTRDPAP